MNNYDLFKDSLNFTNNKVLVSFLGTERFFSSIYNVDIFDFITNQDIMVESQYHTFKKFPEVLFIPGIWPNYGSGIILPSLFGVKINWYKNSSPIAPEPILKNLKEDIYYLDNIDILKNGFGPWYFKTLEKFVSDRRFEDNVYFAWSSGPGELAGVLMGLENLLINMKTDYDNLITVLDKLTDIIINFLEKQFSLNKFAKGFLLTDDISGLISNELYREVLMPFHLRIRKKFKEKFLIFHNDTKSDHILDSLIEAGIDVFNFGPTTNIDLLIEKMLKPKKVAIMGNLDPVGVLMSSDKNFIRGKTRELLNKAGLHPGFILSAGGGLNVGDPESVKVIIEEVAKFNKKNKKIKSQQYGS